MEAERLQRALEGLEDPRRTSGGHILHKLEDIIIIGLRSLLCNGEGFMDMVLGELVTQENSNEIAAVPELLDSLNIAGSIVTADAMSSQKNIVQKIRDNEAAYVIGLKGNQPALLEDVSLYFQDFSKGLPSLATRDKDHGRIEKREYRLLTELSWLPERSDWAGLKAVGSVRSMVTRNGTTSIDTRFFITSLTDINRFSYAVRKHWAIENQLHWSLDVIFDEDSSRARKDFSPLNLNVLRKTALALCKHADFGPRVSMKKNALLLLLIRIISSKSFRLNFKCCCPAQFCQADRF